MSGDGNDILTRPVDVITTEHVFTNQPTTFGYAKLIGDMTEVRLGKAGDFPAQAIDLFHNPFATLKFGVGQVLRVSRVDFTGYPLGRSPGEQNFPLTNGVKKPTTRLDGCFSILDASHAKPQPR